MRTYRKLLSILFIFSIAVFGGILFTKDIQEAKAASAIYINNKDFTLEVDHYRTLKVHGTTQRPTWVSSNSKVATVSSNGRVFARASGTTTVVARVDGKKISCKVNVVLINDKDVTLSIGKTKTLKVWGADDTITWNSTKPSVATISSTGKIIAKAFGTTTITADVYGKSITSKVTVVGINHDSIVLEYNGRFSINAPLYEYSRTLKINDTTNDITWSSSDNTVASVSKYGQVTAKGTGTATITAKVDGVTFTTQVRVLQMSSNLVVLKKGDTKALNIYGTNSKIDWSSYNESIVTVSSDGLVTAKSAGTAKIVGNVDGRIVRSIFTVID
ncbi:MAG TPA: Ig-like domain-containing protein [Mobilitalea sp.]|nr:Ig-like domain-containing protein [Mobilitalea sp.]